MFLGAVVICCLCTENVVSKFYPKNVGEKKKYILWTKIEGIFANKAKVDLGFFFRLWTHTKCLRKD